MTAAIRIARLAALGSVACLSLVAVAAPAMAISPIPLRPVASNSAELPPNTTREYLFNHFPKNPKSPFVDRVSPQVRPAPAA